jgi:5-(aminomethyl)-3-furanmethanol phosphate kinase
MDAERFDAVIKVGGSLGRGPALRALGSALGRLGARYRLLVVPGGGAFADAVRDYYRRYELGETAAHRMALLAMDQYGYLLGEVLPTSTLVQDLWAARQAVAGGRVAILLPAGLLMQADPVPHSWQVTSDSLGAWLAGLAGTRRYVLLKDVDGLCPDDPGSGVSAPVYKTMSLPNLAAHHGGVDDYLVTILARLDLETWVINGQYPERLAELLARGRTLGTCIGQ